MVQWTGCSRKSLLAVVRLCHIRITLKLNITQDQAHQRQKGRRVLSVHRTAVPQTLVLTSLARQQLELFDLLSLALSGVYDKAANSRTLPCY